jgi:hypothetical protein
MRTIDRTADDPTLMQRVALTRLRRFERIAAVADASGSLLWRRLAGHAAAQALRDVVLLGLPTDAEEDADELAAA